MGNVRLGSECDDLPGFIVMMDHQGAPVNGALNWSNGFMPASYQGVPLRNSGEPIAYVRPPEGISTRRQRSQLDLLARWNDEYSKARPADEELRARIASYELAFRMQTSAPETVDLSQESEQTQKMYGLDNKVSQHFAELPAGSSPGRTRRPLRAGLQRRQRRPESVGRSQRAGEESQAALCRKTTDRSQHC